jgi:hypothetical protein
MPNAGFDREQGMRTLPMILGIAFVLVTGPRMVSYGRPDFGALVAFLLVGGIVLWRVLRPAPKTEVIDLRPYLTAAVEPEVVEDERIAA